MSETNGNKLDAREKRKKTVGGTCSGLRLAQEMREQFFSRDSEGAFGMESATRGARFRPELDWEKPWRGQVFGAKMSETNGNKLDAREKWKTTVGGTCSGPQEKCISRSTKYCLPQKTTRSTKNCACHAICISRSTKYCLPRNFCTSRSTKNCACHEISTSRPTKYCHEICISRSTKYAA